MERLNAGKTYKNVRLAGTSPLAPNDLPNLVYLFLSVFIGVYPCFHFARIDPA